MESTIRPLTAGTCKTTHLSPLKDEECLSLKEMGEILADDLPWLTRRVARAVNYLGYKTGEPLATGRNRDQVSEMNRQRRLVRTILVHLLQGDLSAGFVEDLRKSYMPELLEKRCNETNVQDFFTYMKALLMGAFHCEPQENLVPYVRMQSALNRAIDYLADQGTPR